MTLHVRLKDRSYPITITSGNLAAFGPLARSLSLATSAFLVTDINVVGGSMYVTTQPGYLLRKSLSSGKLEIFLDLTKQVGRLGSHIPSLPGLGYPVAAFATLEIYQGQGTDVRAHLASVPEVLELHTITGQGDMLCRIVARSNGDLQRVIDELKGEEADIR